MEGRQQQGNGAGMKEGIVKSRKIQQFLSVRRFQCLSLHQRLRDRDIKWRSHTTAGIYRKARQRSHVKTQKSRVSRSAGFESTELTKQFHNETAAPSLHSNNWGSEKHSGLLMHSVDYYSISTAGLSEPMWLIAFHHLPLLHLSSRWPWDESSSWRCAETKVDHLWTTSASQLAWRARHTQQLHTILCAVQRHCWPALPPPPPPLDHVTASHPFMCEVGELRLKCNYTISKCTFV